MYVGIDYAPLNAAGIIHITIIQSNGEDQHVDITHDLNCDGEEVLIREETPRLQKQFRFDWVEEIKVLVTEVVIMYAEKQWLDEQKCSKFIT